MTVMGERTSRTRTESSERSQSELHSAGLVHELRQPLTGLGAGLRLAARELGASLTELDAWKLASTQLARLEETLETYDRLMTPRGMEASPFVVEVAVRRAVADLAHRLDPVRDRFALVVDPGVPRGHGAPLALQHAVTNLLSNALDALHDAGDTGRIEVRVSCAPGSRPQVRVADEGAGIAPEQRQRLFTPRFTTKTRGSGLGLALSRRMLRACGGELRLAPGDDPARPPWASTVFVIDVAAGPDAPAPHAPAPVTPRWRAALGPVAVLASLAALVLGSWAGFQHWVRAGEDQPPSVTRAARTERVAVAGVTGAIERLHGSSWQALAPGDPLHEDDTVRTGEGSRATIVIGDRSQVTISDATQLTVREITAAAHRLRLTRGRLSVDHQPDGARVLVVESERGDTIARAGTARFSVLANGASLAVATEAGVVRLQAAGRAVDVRPGEESVSVAGEAPSPAAAIPVALLLQVGRAAAGSGGCRIEGSAPTGAEVRVDGKRVIPLSTGRFSVNLPARRGVTHATVVMRDAAGRVVERRVACAQQVDEHVSDFAVRWGHE